MSTLDRPRPTTIAASPSALAPLSDSALAKLVARGRDGAFEVLYERYRADLSRYCRALLRNPEDAEEAFQGTMLNALRALRGGDGGRNMRPWLYRIAHNQCASMIRARRPASALSPEQPSPADPPEDQVALAEQIRHLRADLGSLPALQRSALVMREMAGLSHRAIAEALAVEPTDARQLVYEARRSLDECRIGREAGCAELRTQIADGDRRRLRSRRVRAHLRNCDDCAAYVASQDQRRRGYAALAPAMPAAAGRQVFDRVMGSSGAATAGGGAVIGIPGGVASTIAGLAAGLNPGSTARAWARLPDSTATGIAGAGATAGVALLSLALTALLLNGDNAAHGSAAEPPPEPATALEVAVVAPPGAGSIGYRAGDGAPRDSVVETDVPATAPPAASAPPAGDRISIAIDGVVIPERPAPDFADGLEIADVPEPPPARPVAASPRPRLVDAPPAAEPAPPAPAPAPDSGGADGGLADGAGSGPDPEPAADPSEGSADASPQPDPEVGSVPDPEPTDAGEASPETGDELESSSPRDQPAAPGEGAPASRPGSGEDEPPSDGVDASGGEGALDATPPSDDDAPAELPEGVGSGPDPEPEPASADADTAFADEDVAAGDCPLDGEGRADS